MNFPSQSDIETISIQENALVTIEREIRFGNFTHTGFSSTNSIRAFTEFIEFFEKLHIAKAAILTVSDTIDYFQEGYRHTNDNGNWTVLKKTSLSKKDFQESFLRLSIAKEEKFGNSAPKNTHNLEFRKKHRRSYSVNHPAFQLIADITRVVNREEKITLEFEIFSSLLTANRSSVCLK